MGRNRKRKGDPVHGWLNLAKPADITSTQCVGILKRCFNAQKAGHGGTLDPLADGVLPIAFGEATKTSQWAMDGDKEYVFTITWGVSTDSQDAEGAQISASDARPSRRAIEDWLTDYVGEVEQVPPKFSAIKVNGKRAYDLARGGEAFELKPRIVQVHSAKLQDIPNSESATLHVTCGKGFYVRAVARDLAFDLGCDGHITRLTRTRVGNMRLEDAVPLDVLRGTEDKSELFGNLQPIEFVLDAVPQLSLSNNDAAQIRQGQAVVLLPHLVERWRAEAGADRMAVAMNSDQAIALGEVRAGRFQPSKVFQI